jgi:hypothetical protein
MGASSQQPILGIEFDFRGVVPTARRCALPGQAHYMWQCDHENSSRWNKFLHGVGIPLIFLGIILSIFMKWNWGGSLFFGGWMLLLLGHRIEGNHPAFFQGPIYLLVGPIWVAKEAWEFLAGTHRMPASDGATTSKQS